jgi:hypothetical protein
MFAKSDGTLVRTCWNDLSGAIASDIVDMPRLDLEVQQSAFSHCGSLFAAMTHEEFQFGALVHVSLHNMETMSAVR